MANLVPILSRQRGTNFAARGAAISGIGRALRDLRDAKTRRAEQERLKAQQEQMAVELRSAREKFFASNGQDAEDLFVLAPQEVAQGRQAIRQRDEFLQKQKEQVRQQRISQVGRMQQEQLMVQEELSRADLSGPVTPETFENIDRRLRENGLPGLGIRPEQMLPLAKEKIRQEELAKRGLPPNMDQRQQLAHISDVAEIEDIMHDEAPKRASQLAFQRARQRNQRALELSNRGLRALDAAAPKPKQFDFKNPIVREAASRHALNMSKGGSVVTEQEAARMDPIGLSKLIDQLSQQKHRERVRENMARRDIQTPTGAKKGLVEDIQIARKNRDILQRLTGLDQGIFTYKSMAKEKVASIARKFGYDVGKQEINDRIFAKQEARELASELLHARSGAAVTPAERKYLNSILPDIDSMDDVTFSAAIQRMKRMNDRLEQFAVSALDEGIPVRDPNQQEEPQQRQTSIGETQAELESLLPSEGG